MAPSQDPITHLGWVQCHLPLQPSWTPLVCGGRILPYDTTTPTCLLPCATHSFHPSPPGAWAEILAGYFKSYLTLLQPEGDLAERCLQETRSALPYETKQIKTKEKTGCES